MFLPGDLGFPVAETPVGTLGICVCYDLRFVEVVRLMALRDAELICVPTAWVAGYDVSAGTSAASARRPTGRSSRRT